MPDNCFNSKNRFPGQNYTETSTYKKNLQKKVKFEFKAWASPNLSLPNPLGNYYIYILGRKMNAET